MKIYCCETKCKNKVNNYAICTALANIEECPKRKGVKDGKEDSKGNRNV